MALLAAARSVFERDGFLAARITDISEAAGFSHGTFYTYFRSKEEIFLELAVDLQRTMYGAESHDDGRDERPEETVDPLVGIERANRRYLEGYARNAKLMGIVEQVSMFNDELRIIRQNRADQFCLRAIRYLESLQARGIADPSLVPSHVAVALTSMMSRYAYVWLVEAVDLGTDIDFEETVRTLTIIWASTFGIDTKEYRQSTALAVV